ncbi:MAG: YitT family protein [Tissierellia bacterium]|nr:YitT family protein [Tissierellia bacterium]
MKIISFKRLISVTLGFIIMGFGLYFFLIPANLASGGVMGLAMILNNFFPKLSVGSTMMVLNIFLFILAFIVIGRDFGGYTIYASLGLSGFISIMEKLIPLKAPLTNDILLNLIFGIIIQGVGYALIFRAEASTGGTDIVAKIINKFTHLEIGKSLFLADFLIIIGAIYAFGVDLGLYALLGIFINSLVIDQAIAGFISKINMLIISEEHEKINEFIIVKLDRGSTLYSARGGYSKSDKVIIQTVVSRNEFIEIKDYAESVDPMAFIAVNKVTEVLGEGFTRELES